MFKTLTSFVTFLLLVLAHGAVDAKPDRNKLEIILSGIEQLPTKHSLLQLGPGVDEVLREIVASPSHRRLARNRALTFLRWFPSVATKETLLEVINQTRHSKVGIQQLDLQKALSSYAVVGGPNSLKVVSPFLNHSNRDIRYVAVRAVRLCQSLQSRAVLIRQLDLEKSAMVKVQLKRQIELIDKARKKALTEQK